MNQNLFKYTHYIKLLLVQLIWGGKQDFSGMKIRNDLFLLL